MSNSDRPDLELQSPQRRPWHWPRYPIALAASVCAALALFLAVFPASEVRRPNWILGAFGHFCWLDAEFQHGWPFCYARRDVHRPWNGKFDEPLSAWRPWEGLREFRLAALLMDIGTAVAVILLAGVAVQWWRSRRARWWQWHLRDLFGLMALVGLACAWAASWQLKQQREREAFAAFQQRVPLRQRIGNYVGKDVAVPAFLPEGLALRYRRCFEQVVSVQTDGDTDLACHFPNLALLYSSELRADFGTHVSKMPQLEALDLGDAELARPDVSSDFTVIRDLPPLPNLRILNLRLTSVENADLVWLARCPRLEVVALPLTKIGDDGVRHLTQLKNLRVLSIASDNLTDVGCGELSRIDSLEDLMIVSSQVGDDGVRSLSRLVNLRRLRLRTAASAESVARLREQLPYCKIDASLKTSTSSRS